MKAQLLSPLTEADLTQRSVNGIREVTRKVNLGQHSLTYNLHRSHTIRTERDSVENVCISIDPLAV